MDLVDKLKDMGEVAKQTKRNSDLIVEFEEQKTETLRDLLECFKEIRDVLKEINRTYQHNH